MIRGTVRLVGVTVAAIAICLGSTPSRARAQTADLNGITVPDSMTTDNEAIPEAKSTPTPDLNGAWTGTVTLPGAVRPGVYQMEFDQPVDATSFMGTWSAANGESGTLAITLGKKGKIGIQNRTVPPSPDFPPTCILNMKGKLSHDNTVASGKAQFIECGAADKEGGIGKFKFTETP